MRQAVIDILNSIQNTDKKIMIATISVADEEKELIKEMNPDKDISFVTMHEIFINQDNDEYLLLF